LSEASQAELERQPTGEVSWRVEAGGQRLDQYVSRRVESLSRSQVQRSIQAGEISLNGRAAKPSSIVRPGDLVCLRMPPPAQTDVLPEEIALSVVYASVDVVVLDKPAGVLVHPTDAQRGGTLVNGMLLRYPEIATVGPSGRQGVVHRLDRGTSGLVAFGRTLRGLRRLQEQFREHEVWKTYLALVVGKLEPPKGIVDAPVGRHPRDRGRMAVVRHGGRPARTQYETLSIFPRYSLMAAHPLTGRTHQIRVHFAALGHAVAGDPLYGRGTADMGLQRQFLHAHGLRFVDPSCEAVVELESPLAPDLGDVLARLEQVV